VAGKATLAAQRKRVLKMHMAALVWDEANFASTDL
jgi:hypothetical protein